MLDQLRSQDVTPGGRKLKWKTFKSDLDTLRVRRAALEEQLKKGRADARSIQDQLPNIDAQIAVLEEAVANEDASRDASAFADAKATPLPSHLVGRLVRSEPDINRLPQEPIPGPRQIGDLGDQLRLNPMHSGRTSGDPKRVLRGGGALSGDVARANGSSRRRKSASTLSGMPVPTRPA